jgi:CheY-like chemotaxis protein/Flp pilus assembly protein TadD
MTITDLSMFENPFTKKRYLVIDDFGDMRSMIKGLLRTLGATDIDACRDGQEAIDLMQENRYDVILCDYNLGSGKDGQQVLEEARHRNLIEVASVFIMVTAENTREMVMGAVDYEPDYYLSKPFTKELLQSRLQRLFERKDALVPISKAVAARDFASAIAMIDDQMARKPKNLADLTKLKADVCIQAKRLDEAKAIYEGVLLRRDIPWARLGLGKVQFMQKSYDLAEENFRHLVQHVATLTAAYDWLAKTQRLQGDLAAAQATLEQAVNLSPKVIRRQQALGDLALINDDLESAEKSFGKAVELGKHSVYNHPSLHTSLASAKTAAGKHDEALAVIANINKSFEDSEEAKFYALAAEAVVRQDQGDSTAAEERFAAAQQLYASLGDQAPRQAGLEIAKAASKLGKQDQSAEILNAMIRNNHDDDDFIAEATEVYRETGLSEDAERAVNGIRREIVEMNNQGVRLIREGDFDSAILLFEQAADGLPANRVINLNAARAMVLLMERNGFDKAMATKVKGYADRVKRMAPDDHRLKWIHDHFQRLVLSA